MADSAVADLAVVPGAEATEVAVEAIAAAVVVIAVEAVVVIAVAVEATGVVEIAGAEVVPVADLIPAAC